MIIIMSLPFLSYPIPDESQFERKVIYNSLKNQNCSKKFDMWFETKSKMFPTLTSIWKYTQTHPAFNWTHILWLSTLLERKKKRKDTSSRLSDIFNRCRRYAFVVKSMPESFNILRSCNSKEN